MPGGRELIFNKILLAGAFALATSGGVYAGDSDQRVRYSGDVDARAVCMSIVRDDVPQLRSAFREGRSHPLERSHPHYACNDMRLDEFAFTMGADSVSEYLAPKFGREGRVYIEQIGSVEH